MRKSKIAIIFLIIVMLPAGVLMWLGYRLVRYEQLNIQNSFKNLLQGQLFEYDKKISELLELRKQEILGKLEGLSCSAIELRQLKHSRGRGTVEQFFCLAGNGSLVYPSPDEDLSDDEWDFLQKTGDTFSRNILLSMINGAHPEHPGQSPSPTKNSKSIFSRSIRTRTDPVQQQAIVYDHLSGNQELSGWFSWFWGQGVHLLVWHQRVDQSILGAELNRIRLIADVIGMLPHTDPGESLPLKGRICLVNALGETLYQWGSYVPAENAAALVERTLSEPLITWKLQYFVSPEQQSVVGGVYSHVFLLMSLTLFVLILAGLSVYVYREYTREVREAQQRITFVNQVSHELKTPLTNIRMYAELLEQRIYGDEKSEQQVQIIVSESQRLSRLIGNILSFSRKERDKLSCHPTPGVIDEAIESVIESFTPSFRKAGITISFSGEAGKAVMFDHDCFEQILGNLLNNVEKYAAEGKNVELTSSYQRGTTRITVQDFGPGIPAREATRIFDAFTRLSNKVTDGVAGTGIGLSIARDLARMHGGDVTLATSTRGCLFQIILRTPERRGD